MKVGKLSRWQASELLGLPLSLQNVVTVSCEREQFSSHSPNGCLVNVRRILNHIQHSQTFLSSLQLSSRMTKPSLVFLYYVLWHMDGGPIMPTKLMLAKPNKSLHVHFILYIARRGWLKNFISRACSK